MAKKRSATDVARAKILRERRRKLSFKTFTPEEKSICGRVAELLFWCAEKYPHQIITYEEVTQAIFDLGRIPARTAKYVKSVRGQMSSTGKKLVSTYRRSLITVPGVGVRCAVDDADILKYSVTKAADRHRRSVENLTKLAELVNPEALKQQLAEMLGDPELKEEIAELSKWLTGSVHKLIAMQKRHPHAAALLPPPPAA